jgi:hypothetical protein
MKGSWVMEGGVGSIERTKRRIFGGERDLVGG